ncbi:MAG: SdrD B-like domain-containing protein [Campylobacteraceae bacterium]
MQTSQWLFKKFLFIFIFSLFFSTNLNAANVVFDCNTLYGANDYGRVYKFLSPTVNTKSEALFYANAVTSNSWSTIALGPFGEENGTLTMFGTSWSWSTAGRIRYVANNSIAQYSSGAQNFAYFTMPRPAATPYDYYSGGEVNQLTGQIYFTSGELDDLNNGYRIVLATPSISGSATNIINSGKITPKTSSDIMAGGVTTYLRTYVSSDVAIDAEGNAYILVREGYQAENSQPGNYWLVKVEPSTPGNWKFSKVKKITGLPATYFYGMAFLNGKLYAAGGYLVGDRRLFEVDPLLGVATDKGYLGSTVSGRRNNFDENDAVFDLASCQVATAITGKVYLDEDGDGIITGKEPGIADVVVAIYDKNGKYLGEQTTSGDGSYSFLSNDVGTSNSVLYIRLKQPQINGANTMQTWASGGWSDWRGVNGIKGNNTAEPQCYDTLTTKQNESYLTNSPYQGQNRYYYGRTCHGAKEDGIDPSYPTNLGVSDGKLNGAAFYTKITMPTDRANVKADFALAPVDRSDSPISYGESSHLLLKNNIYLGSNVDADNTSMHHIDANNDKFDDGMFIKDASNDSSVFKTPQDYIFENKKTYTFRAYVNTTTSTSQFGYLYGWISLSDTITTSMANNYSAGINLVSALEVNTSQNYVDFNFTVPDNAIVNSSGNKSKAFIRFRFSTYNNLNMSPVNPELGSTEANSVPWVTSGEVEDYKMVYHYIPVRKPLGEILIVNENFPSTATKIDVNDHSQVGLYTQVAGKEFKVTFVYTDGKGNIISPESPQEMTIQLIKSFSGSTEDDCKNAITVLENVMNENKTVANLEKINMTLQKEVVSKDLSFRVKYWAKSSPSEVKYSCSKDDFALRPAKFDISGYGARLIGGKNEDITIKALDISGATFMPYNQNVDNVIINDGDISLIITAVPACTKTYQANDFTFTKTSNVFTNGTATGNINYNNVGKLKIKMYDANWAVNSKDILNSDCIENSGSNTFVSGKVGCNIELEKELDFYPSELVNTLSLNNFNDGAFTYLANEQEMQAGITMSLTAVLDDGTTAATNYHQNCWSRDVTYEIDLANNPFGWGTTRGTVNDRIRYMAIAGDDATLNEQTGAVATLTTLANVFQDGVANNLHVNFNFNRQFNTFENPFRVNSTDFTMSSADADGVTGDDFDDDGSTATFYYGRVWTGDERGPSPLTATTRYEAYCGVGCATDDFGLLATNRNTRETGSNWYRNANHNLLEQGSVEPYTQANGDYITMNHDVSITIVAGQEDIDLTNTENPPKADDIIMNTNNWLIYNNRYIVGFMPRFKVEFEGAGGGWAGEGEVNNADQRGRVIDATPSTRSKQKLDW